MCIMEKCKYGDDACPCQDGDLCHYENYGKTKAMRPPEGWIKRLERLAMAIYKYETNNEVSPVPFTDPRCKQAYIEFAEAIIENFDELDRCDICGDVHEPDNIPRECETGDGV